MVVGALGAGRQILILRKGGIHEEKGGFAVSHSRFLLFPTFFHQQWESVIETAEERFDEFEPNTVRLKFWAQAAAARRLDSLADAHALRGQHIWREEVIARRFESGREKNVFAMAVRVFRLREKAQLPMLPSYGGCKSWVKLESDVDTRDSRPVLSDEGFAAKLEEFRSALAPTPVPVHALADSAVG